jgi:hypothetical protein
MSDIDLQSKFPDMRPIRSAPTLQTVNGIGFSMCGARDFDEQTRTYVKTHCFCFLFIPLVALGAYRVLDAGPAGWYFIGRVPLSLFARAWNYLLLFGILGIGGFVGWNYYSSTPEYAAGRKLGEADRLAAAGKVGQAARLYREVARGGTSQASNVRTRLEALLDEPLAKAEPAEAVEALRVVGEVQPGARQRLFDRGMKLAEQHADKDARGALAILNGITPLAPKETDLTDKREPLLKRLVAQEPDNVELASQLALIYEARKQPEQCTALLAPLEKNLGTSEGARILGQIYAHQDKIEQAHTLLLPYAEGRLKQLHDAEKTIADRVHQVQEQILQELQSGKAPGFDYARHREAGEAARKALVLDYLDERLKNDPDLKQAQEAVIREAGVVPVALDLGVVLLRRAQTMADPAARRAELEKAEKTFLAVRGQVGETEAFRLNLGQVYYWLGKHAEGRKLFDEVLAGQQRSSEILIGVSRLLREVGAIAEARTLAEEAYTREANEEKKQAVAVQRALLAVDLDDKITWLRRSNTADPRIKALLSSTRGNKAMEEGKEEEAADHLRQAIAAYAALPEDAATLNNSATAHFLLYRLTGERQTLDKGSEMIEKALALHPSDSILLSNAVHAILEGALSDLIGKAIDLKTLKMEGSLDLLPYLYQDQAGRDRLAQRFRQHPGIAKATAYLKRWQLLAPKNLAPYAILFAMHSMAQDRDALRQLLQRLQEAELDLADVSRKTLDYYAGRDDARTRTDLDVQQRRQEATLAAARKNAPGVTVAVAATHLAQTRIQQDGLGVAVKGDEVVALAEEAHAAAPSSATHGDLVAALLLRASQALAKQEPAYAALLAKGRRCLEPSYLIAVVLERNEKLRAPVLANKDVQRALALVREETAKWPEDQGVWVWAMLRFSYPDEAAKLADLLRKNDLVQAERAIEPRLQPFSGTAAVREAWALQIAGKEAEGREVLKQCAKRGVPLPFDP